MTKECECAAHSAAECVCGAWDAPPQRTWEGLSVFEINDLVENTEYEDYRGLVERTEAKLKGKNT